MKHNSVKIHYVNDMGREVCLWTWFFRIEEFKKRLSDHHRIDIGDITNVEYNGIMFKNFQEFCDEYVKT